MDLENKFLTSEIAKEIWKNKYKLDSDNSIEDQWRRNAKAAASVEKTKELKDEWEEKFYNILYGHKFLPGGRICYALGHPANRVSASNCYVTAIEDDSLDAIYDTLKKHGLTYRSTGGIGSDISILRPYGDKIDSSGGETPGATAFMDLYSNNTNTISQQGRRGALLMGIYIHHPDIERFISIKNDKKRSKVKHANISVKLTDEFMNAVFNDDDFDLYWPCTPDHERITGKSRKVYRTVKAKELWNKIIEMATLTAEPGLLFWDTALRYHNGEGLGLKAENTNPCIVDYGKVFTFNGPTELKKIKAGDRIWSTEGWTTVIKIVKKRKKQAVYKYITENGAEFIGTANHKIIQKMCKIEVDKAEYIDVFVSEGQGAEYGHTAIPSKIIKKEFIAEETVYDVTVDNSSHTFWYNKCDIANCGEQILPAESNCNLGHMNLEKYVTRKSFSYKDFENDLRIALRFMDNVIDFNKDRHALKAQSKRSLEERRVGLGITGLGSALIKLGIKYDTQDAIDIAEKIAKTWMETLYDESVNLAIERGSFPAYNWEGFYLSEFIKNLPEKLRKRIQEYGIRNITLNTIAPTGTVSIVAETSSGIEPFFAFAYDRLVKQQDGEQTKKYKVYERIYKEMKELLGFESEKDIPDYMITAHSIDPYFRVKMQSTWQKYCDSAISSTVNLPRDTSSDKVKDIYEYAYRMGLKGITVYVEGCREGVLITEDSKKPKKHPIILNYGTTFKIPIKAESNLYITIHPNPDNEKLPYAIFMNSNDMSINARTMGQAILLSSMLQLIDQDQILYNINGIISNFKNIEDTSVGAWFEGVRIKSIEHAVTIALSKFMGQNTEKKSEFSRCPECSQNTFVAEGGCEKCLNPDCDFQSKCG